MSSQPRMVRLFNRHPLRSECMDDGETASTVRALNVHQGGDMVEPVKRNGDS